MRLVARNGGKVLDVSHHRLAYSTDIAQWSRLDDNCQRRHLMPV